MTHRHTILVADNQYLITEALQKILTEADGFELLDIVRSPEELVKFFSRNTCDILTIDISILRPNDLHKLGNLKAGHPATVIVVLSSQVSRVEVSSLNKMGINTILYKNAERQDIFEALHAALKGRKYYSPEIMDMLLVDHNKPDIVISLTGAEKEVVGLIAEGLTTKEIAERKNISFHTVMTHRKNIFRKLGINNVSELMMFAIKSGLIDNIEYYI
jgi:DNA-binding NarL/FixJ family response regulator